MRHDEISTPFLALVLASPSYAAPCMPKDQAVSILRSEHGEVRWGAGMEERGQGIWEIWVNPETRTWTIWEIRPNGSVCVKANGGMWFDEMLATMLPQL